MFVKFSSQLVHNSVYRYVQLAIDIREGPVEKLLFYKIIPNRKIDEQY